MLLPEQESGCLGGSTEPALTHGMFQKSNEETRVPAAEAQTGVAEYLWKDPAGDAKQAWIWLGCLQNPQETGALSNA